MPTATVTATSLRKAVDDLRTWLVDHPDIPIDYIEFVDEFEVEMTSCATGGFTPLITAADVADALTDPSIEVTDLDNGLATRLAVSGTVADGLSISVTASVLNGARRAFLRSINARPLDEAVIWTTTSAHLRAVAAAGDA
jgi:hypothetical protein